MMIPPGVMEQDPAACACLEIWAWAEFQIQQVMCIFVLYPKCTD